MSPRRDVSMTRAEVASFLAVARTATLCTLGRDGFPHCAGMWFVFDCDELRMWTYAKSQKAKNAARDPRCSFLVEEGTRYWELKGVSVTGTLRVVTDFDAIADIGRRLYELYTLPATGIPIDAGPEAEIVRQAHKRVGLVLPLERVASWDHGKL